MAALKPLIIWSKTLQNPLFFESSTLKIGYGALQLTTQAQKMLFQAKKWHFLAIFGQKMRVFLVMAAPKHSITCSKKNCKTRFFDSSTLKIGWGALQLPTQAPKTLFWAKNGIFLAIFGQKMRFFGDSCSKTIDNLLQNLAKHLLLSPAS